MENDNQNYKQTGVIRSVLNSEVKFVIGIIVAVFGVAAPFFAMRQDIALIQQSINNINGNHEVHIQDLTQAVKDLQEANLENQKAIITLQQQILNIQRK